MAPPAAARRARPRPGIGRLSPPARESLILLLKPWARWAAHTAITGHTRSRADPAAGRFTRAEVNALLREAWTRLGQLTPGLPAEPTPGSRQNVLLLAALTLALFHALLDDGIERGYAIELTGDACWKIYAQWGQIPHLTARLRTRDPARRATSARTSPNHKAAPSTSSAARSPATSPPTARPTSPAGAPGATWTSRSPACGAAPCNAAGRWPAEPAECDFRFRATRGAPEDRQCAGLPKQPTAVVPAKACDAVSPNLPTKPYRGIYRMVDIPPQVSVD